MRNILFNATLKICGWIEDKLLGGHEYHEWSTEEGHVGHSSGGGRLTYCDDTEGDGVEGIKIGRLHWVRSYSLSNYENPVFVWTVRSVGYWRISRCLKYMVCRRFVDSRIRIIRNYCYNFVVINCTIPSWDKEYIANKLKRSITG